MGFTSAKNNTRNNRKISNKSFNKKNYSQYYILAGILVLTFIIYAKTIHNGFISAWDDDQYVYNNHDITDLSVQGLKNLFSRFYVSCYLPLTMLTYALEYKFFALNPAAYHIDNIILHLLNIVLVFFFVKSLFSSLASPNSQLPAAYICALLFAVHPMHVESVAWIAERKDLLYTFFFLASLIFYLKYIKKETQDTSIKTQKNQHSTFYFLSLLMFLFSLLSKSMAVTLPVVLLLIDYFKGKLKFNTRYLIEKLPFFLLALLFGVITFISQKAFIPSSYDKNIVSLNIIDRFFMLNYSVAFYILKLFIPYNLSALYPYPLKTGGLLPIEYYLSPLFIAGLLYLILRFIKRTANNGLRTAMIFGILFYLVTISVVLMVVPVGHAIVAERYSYVPYLGFFIIIGSVINSKIERLKDFEINFQIFKSPYLLIVLAFCVLFSVSVFSRTDVWQDGITLFSDVIEKHPDVSMAYTNRGMVNAGSGNFNAALVDLNKAIDLDSHNADAFNNRGSLRLRSNYNNGALEDFNKAIALKPDYEDAFLNRGLLKINLNDYKNAVDDFNKVISLKPELAVVYNDRGWAKTMTGDYKGAIDDYNKCLQLNPDLELTYINRGTLKGNMNDFTGALKDFDVAISLNPKEPKGFFGRSFIKNCLHDYKGALDDLNTTIVLNPDYALAFFNRGNIEFSLNDKTSACNDWNSASKLGLAQAQSSLDKYCK